MVACPSTPQKSSGKLVKLKLQIDGKAEQVTESDQSFGCTKITGSMAFGRPQLLL